MRMRQRSEELRKRSASEEGGDLGMLENIMAVLCDYTAKVA
jgi:hypothetical protein